MKILLSLREWAVPLRERLSLLLPFIASIALALGATQRLAQAVRGTGARAAEVNRLTREIEMLEQRRSAAESEAIESRHAEARAKLIAGEPGAREWLRNMKIVAAQHGFDVQTQVGTAGPRRPDAVPVDVVPLSLELVPRSSGEAEQVASVRLTRLLLDLTARPEWVEVLQLSLEGRGAGLEAAKLTVHLWVDPPAT